MNENNTWEIAAAERFIKGEKTPKNVENIDTYIEKLIVAKEDAVKASKYLDTLITAISSKLNGMVVARNALDLKLLTKLTKQGDKVMTLIENSFENTISEIISDNATRISQKEQNAILEKELNILTYKITK